MTLPSPWALLLYACTKTVKPFLQSLFHPYTSSRKCHFYRTRQAWICSCEHCRLQCPVSSNQLAFHCRQSNGRQSRFTTMYHRRNTSNRSHARMTMTVTGLPHGGRKANFPLICSAALNPSTWRCTPIPLFHFPFRLSMRMPLFPCRHPGRHQVSFSLLGAKIKTGLGTQIFVEKSPRPFRGSILSKKFANPTP